MNPSFISHSLPYNYDSLEVVKSSQFISSPSTRSLDDDRIGLLSADDINNSEKHSNQYPLVTDISEIKSNECLKIPFHHELSSSSSLTTLISQDSSKSQHSILNDVSEKSIGKEGLCNEHEIQLFEVEKSKNKELEEESTSIIIPETPSMICGEVSKMQFTNIVNKNDNSSNNNNNIKIIGFNGSKFKNNLTTYNGNGNAYMNIISKNNNENNNTLVPPQKPQKSIKRIKENELRAAAQNVCNTSSDNLNIDVNSIIPARKTSLGTPFIKNKRNQLKVKISNENDGSPLKTYENIPSPVPSNSSLENECYKSNRSISNEIGNINSNSNLLVPNKIQKQLLLKPKAISGNEHKNYPRRESLKQQHPVIKTLDKNQSSPIIIQGPLSAPPYLDVYNNGLKDDYKMESIIKDIGKKKNPLSKIKEKVHEKPQKPNKENVFEIKPFPRRSSLKDNSILEEINKKKEKETEELSKKLSKELEKKQLKEKEAQKKKSKKEAKREKKEKRSEEKLDKYNINKLKISSPQLISTDELNTDNSTISVKKEKSKKGWYQLALSKLPTSKSSNSQNKKNNLFSDFKKGDTSSEILIKRTPTCSSHTSVRRRVINSNRASVCTTGTTNTISTQTSIPYGSQFDVLPEVPAILKKCISLIEECGLETEGLYRISGNSSNVQNLLKLFRLEPDKIQLLPPGNEPLKSSSRKTFKSSSNIPPPSSSLYKDSKYLYDNDIHVVTGCIKSWLRNGIPPKNEPLWPYNMYDDLIKASQIKDYTNRMIAFQDLVHALPPMNFTSLNFLFEHLFKVSTYSEQNKMTISNLAIIFGPTLLKSPPDSNENELMIITRMPFQCKAVEVLIEQYEWLFGPIEYEEESIDEDLDMNLINSSFNEIQNHIQKEIKNNEVVILKNKSNDNIDLVVNNSDKINNKIYSKLEINEKDLMGSLVEKIEKNDHNKISEKSSSQSNSKYNSNEEKKNEMEEQSESTECDNCFSQKEKNYYAVNKSDCESFISNDSQEEEYETLPRCINSSDFELSSFEQGIEKDIKNYSEIKVIPNSKNQKYSHSMNIETIKKMKKTSSEELLEFIEDDDKSDKNFKGEKKKDKERIKIKNSNSSNRLKQLLNRQNKSKKMENDSFLSNNDFKNLISSPNSVKKNNILNSLEKEKKTYEKINKNSNLLISNKNSKQDDFDEEINLCIPSNNVYKILNGNKNSQMSSEPNIYENDFSEKTLISHGNNNFDINQYNEKKKGKELTQKISISSMRIFQEQFLMDGFENDIESSLNDFLSKKFEFDDENGTLDDDKDENMLRKSSIIRLSTQMTAKWNLELEKHLEQIYRDKKRSKLFINDDLDNIEEKIKNININQNSISKTNH